MSSTSRYERPERGAALWEVSKFRRDSRRASLLGAQLGVLDEQVMLRVDAPHVQRALEVEVAPLLSARYASALGQVGEGTRSRTTGVARTESV